MVPLLPNDQKKYFLTNPNNCLTGECHVGFSSDDVNDPKLNLNNYYNEISISRIVRTPIVLSSGHLPAIATLQDGIFEGFEGGKRLNKRRLL